MAPDRTDIDYRGCWVSPKEQTTAIIITEQLLLCNHSDRDKKSKIPEVLGNVLHDPPGCENPVCNYFSPE